MIMAQLMAEKFTSSPVPRKLNDGLITALSDAIAKGNYTQTACKLCGISEFAFYDWLKLAAKDEEAGLDETNSIYIRLAKALQKAEADSEARLVSVVREAAEVKREWLPAITFLERRHPDRWGRKDRTQVDITERKDIRITHVEIVMGQPAPAIEGEVIKEETRRLEGGKDG